MSAILPRIGVATAEYAAPQVARSLANASRGLGRMFNQFIKGAQEGAGRPNVVYTSYNNAERVATENFNRRIVEISKQRMCAENQ